MSEKLIVQIPDEVIRNTYCKMDSYTFALYTLFRFLHFRNYHVDEMEIDHKSIKHKLYISDNRTLKRAFETLHKNGFILEYINKFPTKGSLNITFNPIPFDSVKFTQLPVTILNKIDHIGQIGFRLLFYYESYINRTDPNRLYAFPAIETVSRDLNINHETVLKYNGILIKHKLLKVIKHEVKFGENTFDDCLFTKYNNHYYVLKENL